MRRAFLICCAAALLAPTGARVSAEEGADAAHRAWDVTADSISYERERDVYTARGNVRIVQPGRSLTADWLAFSNTTRRGVATGHVVIQDQGQRLDADAIQFQLDDLRGILLDGRLEGKNTPFIATGDEVRKLSENEYEFQRGTFTTCRCPDDETEPWKLRAESAELEIGGYGTTRNTVVDVLGVPVLWLPWMRYPLLTDRASGLLFPTFGTSSRRGVDVGLPLFWAALPSLNVTLTPHYLTKRGFKPELDLEYVLGEKSYGSFFASGILDDAEVKSDNPDTPDVREDRNTPFGANRWGLSTLDDLHLPGGARIMLDGTLFSDNLYPFDFREFTSLRSDRFVESVGFLEDRFGELGRFGLVAGARYADDIQNPDNLDRDPFLLQRVGEIAVSGMPERVTDSLPLEVAFDTQLINFYPHQSASSYYGMAAINGQFLDTGIDALPDGVEENSNGVVPVPDGTQPNDDPNNDDLAFPGGTRFEGDGLFEEGEPLVDRGQRLLVNPRVALPLRIADVAELRTEIGYHGTLYTTAAQSFASRHLATAIVDLRTRLRREIELPFVDERATHLLEPRLAWTWINDTSQGGNPLFVPRGSVPQERIRQLELYNVLRDPSDRIEATNALTFALGNRLFVPTTPGESGMLEPPRLFADVTLSASWDFTDSSFRNLYVDGDLFPARRWRMRFNTGYDITESRISEALFEFGYSDERGNDVGIGYRFVENVPPFFDGFDFDHARFDNAVENFDKINQIELFGRYAFTRYWAASYRLRYSIEGSLSLTNEGSIEYISRCRCWAAGVVVAQDRQAGVSTGLRYRIVGLGDDSVRPFGSHRGGTGDAPIERF